MLYSAPDLETPEQHFPMRPKYVSLTLRVVQPRANPNQRIPRDFLLSPCSPLIESSSTPLQDGSSRVVLTSHPNASCSPLFIFLILLGTKSWRELLSGIGLLPKRNNAIPKEARNFGLGETTYYVVLVCSGIIWQCFYLGAIGVTFSASSLLSAIIIAMLLPVTEILAVIFYSEKFRAEKGVSLVLSLWGFVSYFYGEIKESKEIQNQNPETQMPQINHAP
ncbi:unnamed protein product [Thlaspi arvense]|uniref:EamA domain-containing protein n=1 Tax=Thlaspi arvense TaxID=13288 RepID=A0AAU9RHC9_THLAR|nr:unnamed protein product [Thlaspi arvense]